MRKTVHTGNIKKSPEFGVQTLAFIKADSLQWGRRRSKEPSSKHCAVSVFRFSLLTFHCFILFFVVSACSTPYYAYSKGVFHGKEAFKRGDYEGARQNFEEAYRNDRTGEAAMYLAITEYKTNNLDSAERLIREAETIGSNSYHYLRVLGYKALILLRIDRNQGMEALGRYVAFYSLSDPLMSIQDVQEMWQSGNVDLVRLENLIEEQVSWHENDVELYLDSGVGYYDGRDGIGGSSRFRGGVIFR